MYSPSGCSLGMGFGKELDGRLKIVAVPISAQNWSSVMYAGNNLHVR